MPSHAWDLVLYAAMYLSRKVRGVNHNYVSERSERAKKKMIMQEA